MRKGDVRDSELAWTQWRHILWKQAQFFWTYKEVSVSATPLIRSPGNQPCMTESWEPTFLHKTPKPQKYAGRLQSLILTWKILHYGPKQPLLVMWPVANFQLSLAWTRVNEADENDAVDSRNRVSAVPFSSQWTLNVKMLFKTDCLTVVVVKYGPVWVNRSTPMDFESTRILVWILIWNFFIKTFFQTSQNYTLKCYVRPVYLD